STRLPARTSTAPSGPSTTAPTGTSPRAPAARASSNAASITPVLLLTAAGPTDPRMSARIRPVIGVTLDAEPPGGYSKYPWYALRANYATAVAQFGGLPVAL